ncbi:MAG TPA: serine hydrolase domain-containing protein [Kribbella sp.]|nr:serine hydrolase domain-containing protein [Kribbella sp.]
MTRENWTARLDHLDQLMAGYVERGEIAGLVTLVSRGDDVRLNVAGAKAIGGDPMRRDTLFRVASFTKPVTAAAAMILLDDGKLRLDQPVADLLPELADRKVLTRPDGPLDDTVPADRAITLHDLLTFRLGLGYSDNKHLQQAEHELQLMSFGPPKPRTPHEPDEWMRRLARLPLQYQPGEQWLYNTGSQILGVLVARAAGQPLEAFLRERLFEPLGMTDTGFTVPPEKLDRLATSYQDGEVFDGVEDSQWISPPAFPDGAGGLVSTADDYLAFARMLLRDGQGILSPASVEQMTTNQLLPGQTSDFLGDAGWGLGLSVAADRYGWDGGLGTSWYNVPGDDLVAILLTQRAFGPDTMDVVADFSSLVS